MQTLFPSPARPDSQSNPMHHAQNQTPYSAKQSHIHSKAELKVSSRQHVRVRHTHAMWCRTDLWTGIVMRRLLANFFRISNMIERLGAASTNRCLPAEVRGVRCSQSVNQIIIRRRESANNYQTDIMLLSNKF